MADVRKTLRFLFLAIFIGVGAFMLIQFAVSQWRARDLEKKVLASCRVTVVGEYSGFPPALRVEFVNDSGRDISPTHFRLVFYCNDRQVSRLDKNFSIKPGDKLNLLLESKASGVPPSPGSRINYELSVYPMYKRNLPTIRGEMILKNP